MHNNPVIARDVTLSINNHMYIISALSLIELIYYYSVFFNTFNFIYYINIICCIFGFNGSRYLNNNRITLYGIYHIINTGIIIYNLDNDKNALFLFFYNMYIIANIYKLNIYINDIHNIISSYESI